MIIYANKKENKAIITIWWCYIVCIFLIAFIPLYLFLNGYDNSYLFEIGDKIEVISSRSEDGNEPTWIGKGTIIKKLRNKKYIVVNDYISFMISKNENVNINNSYSQIVREKDILKLEEKNND